MDFWMMANFSASILERRLAMALGVKSLKTCSSKRGVDSVPSETSMPAAPPCVEADQTVFRGYGKILEKKLIWGWKCALYTGVMTIKDFLGNFLIGF